jgi:hypothetical protein
MVEVVGSSPIEPTKKVLNWEAGKWESERKQHSLLKSSQDVTEVVGSRPDAWQRQVGGESYRPRGYSFLSDLFRFFLSLRDE